MILLCYLLIAGGLALFPNLPAFIRYLVYVPFILVVPGFLLAKMLLSNRASATTWVIVVPLLSFLILYPASILTVVIEGQSGRAIFGPHFGSSFLSLDLISFCLLVIVTHQEKYRNNRPVVEKFSSSSLLLLLFSILIFSSLVFSNLGRANVFGDEYDISYQAYNLIDGIADGRKSFLLSFNTHPPLALNIQHYFLQVVDPGGLDSLSDWQYRTPEAIAGVLSLILIFFITRDFFGEKTAALATLFFSVNNYHVWMSRFVDREIFLTLFMIGFIYTFKKIVIDGDSNFWLLTGVLLGAALLIKASGLILLPVLIGGNFLAKNGRRLATIFGKILLVALIVFLPVIIYNLAAYFLTGFTDSLFVHILPGARNPFATAAVANPLNVNPPTIFFLLIDQMSLPVFILGALGALFFFFNYLRTKDKVCGLIFGWSLFSLIFYIPFMVRAYYLHFLTVPFAIGAGYLLTKVPNRLILTVITLALLCYSYLYAYKTNVDRSYTLALQYNDAGRSGGSLLIPSLGRNFSLAARSWSEDRGWAQAVGLLARQKDPFCLVVDPRLDEIALRRYFWYHDLVKKSLAGSFGSPRFPVCQDETSVIPIYLTQTAKGNIVIHE